MSLESSSSSIGRARLQIVLKGFAEALFLPSPRLTGPERCRAWALGRTMAPARRSLRPCARNLGAGSGTLVKHLRSFGSLALPKMDAP